MAHSPSQPHPSTTMTAWESGATEHITLPMWPDTNIVWNFRFINHLGLGVGTRKAVLSHWSARLTSCLLLQPPSPLPGRLAQGGAWAYIGSHFGKGWPEKLQPEKVRRGL